MQQPMYLVLFSFKLRNGTSVIRGCTKLNYTVGEPRNNLCVLRSSFLFLIIFARRVFVGLAVLSSLNSYYIILTHQSHTSFRSSAFPQSI